MYCGKRGPNPPSVVSTSIPRIRVSTGALRVEPSFSPRIPSLILGPAGFTEPMNRENVKLEIDSSLGMERIEVICKRCDSHLGHLFDDGPKDKGGKRFCINSCALDLELGKGKKTRE
jgi:hypothetical protein